ncbi:MAG TPA: VOC family protein [Thermoanaerobaculia bacterium]
MSPRKCVVFALFLFTAGACATAPAPPPRPAARMQPYLVALSVPDVDESIRWYVTNLGFQQKSRAEYPDYGLVIAIVERDGFRVELVALKGSVAPASVVADHSNPAILQGFNKIAFRVDDLAAWAKEFRGRGVKFQLQETANPQDNSSSFIIVDNNGNWLQFTQVNR